MSAFQLQPPTAVRRFRLRHATDFTYDRPIDQSTHRLHLRPVSDWKQRIIDHRLELSPNSVGIEYEDAFGNWTTRYEVNSPYQEMKIEATSVVELLDVDPFLFTTLLNRPMFPLAWMPWDHKMLSPYLTPVELPETQLLEIYDYAISFAERNQQDLMETLFDMNLTLFREFQYTSGVTNLATTPYDVLVNKQGVCQDFANLMICMARLLNLPARYVCGYVFLGNTESGAMPAASHAWVQIYIPNVGWKGFDPTNGILPSTEHVRVAVGRHYRDTAPVSGTLYTMAQETMQTVVEMVEIDTEGKPLQSSVKDNRAAAVAPSTQAAPVAQVPAAAS